MSDYESEPESDQSDVEEVGQKYKKGEKKDGAKVAKKMANKDKDNDSDESSVETDDDENLPIDLRSNGSLSDDDDDLGSQVDPDEIFGDMTPSPKKTQQNPGASAEADEFQFGFDSDDENEDEDEDDLESEQYLQKIDNTVREHTIKSHHPELLIHNYEEVEALSTVVRNKHGIIIDPLHKTLPFLTKYERTRILGERTKQINEGAKPFVQVESSIIDGYLIALAELEQKKIPFIIRRPLANGTSEYWKLKDLEFII